MHASAEMDGLAVNTLTSIRGSGLSIDSKLKHLTELKAEIKHRHCPEAAVGPLFEVIRLSLATPHLTDAGFSILGHLTKRLELQNQGSLLQSQGVKTYPCLLDRLADSKDRTRQRANQALTDFHAVAPADVEHFVRDGVLKNKSPRAKESGMLWILTTRKERNIAFKAFVPHIVDCLEDSDGNVRQMAQTTIITLFQMVGPKGMNDLQRHLEQRNVRRSIVDHILSELGPAALSATDTHSVAESFGTELPKNTPSFSDSASSKAIPASSEAPPMSVSEQEAVQLDPIYVESSKDLDEAFREMHPHFEGKESEQNWLKREKSVLRLRKMTKGNVLQDFPTAFLANIKGLLDGILKTVNSLRTTVSTLGCHLVQDLARAAGSGLDNMVEILLQNLIKLCASTKKIAAAKGNDTVAAVMANVSYNVRLVQHIHSACQDKNVQPRIYACGWLKIIITKHGHHKSALEHSGGLDLIEKSLRAGLVDRDPNVRESMRPTYWAFASYWSNKSESVLTSLDERNQKALISNAANPNPEKPMAAQGPATGGKSGFSQSTGSAPTHIKPSFKETIAAQKKAAKAAKAAGRNIPSRPGSAEPLGSPKKSASQSNMGRPATAMSTASRNVSVTSVGTLSSAPVRPRRRADIARPATADLYASVKPIKTGTPPRSPATSPAKRTKSSAPTANPTKLGPRKIDSPASTSPVKGRSPSKHGSSAGSRQLEPDQSNVSPTKAAEDLTMVVPNFKSSAATNSAQPKKSPESLRPTSSAGIPSFADPFSSTQLNTPHKAGSPTNRFGWNNASSEDKTLSPTKVIDEFGRMSMKEGQSERISMSPRALVSKKENTISRSSHTQSQRPLQVYEDPDGDSNKTNSYPSPLIHTPRALEELPVSEPAKNRLAMNTQLLAEEPHSPEYHQKWLAIEASERRRISASENIENPRRARKILDSGIERVRAGSLDVHGFRKLQTLIRTSGDSIWEGGYKFDELLVPLLEYLEAPMDESHPRSAKVQDLKTQDLVTIRLLLQHQPKYFAGYHPRAITAVLTARKHYNSTSHIVCGLEETVESIVHQCDPVPCIESVMDLLEDQRTNGSETSAICMGLYVLAGLLHRGQEKGNSLQLSEQLELILGETGSRFLVDTNPDVRRAVIEFVLELHDSVRPDRFWGLISGEREDHRSLITYYLARRRAIAQ